MRKRKMRLFFLFFLSPLVLGASFASSSFAQIKTDRVFPDATQIFFAVADVKDLAEHWKKTNFSETISDPKFDAFRKSLREQIENAWPNRLGMTFEDFAALPSGEIAGGLIAPPGQKPGFAILMNVSGNAAQVNDFLVRLVRQTSASKLGEATKERLSIGSQSVEATVVTFPPDETHATARSAYYVALPQLLLATDQKYLAEALLRKLAGDAKNSLASRPEYRAIFERLAQDAKAGSASQIRFFVNPLGAGEAIRSLTPPEQLKGRSPFDVLAKQGFDGIKGVGGTIDFSAENFETVYRIKVYVPEPPTRALKMFSFDNVPELTPPSWVAENAIRYTTVNLDALTAFNNVGPLFDEFLETEGAWNDILDSLEKDKRGPHVNLRVDLFANLGRRFASTNSLDPKRPDDGEKFLFSLNVLPGKDATVAETLRRMFESDPDFAPITFDGSTFWQYSPQQRGATSPSKPAATSASRETRPTRPTRPSASGTSKRPTAESVAASKAEPGPEAEIVKGGVFGVANGYLFVSNDAQFLFDKLAEAKVGGGSSILNSPQHARATAILNRETTKTNGLFIRGYARNVDGLRANYELFRQGKTPQGKTLSAKILNAILVAPDAKNAPRKARFDGSTLPPFEEIADSIGFGAFFGAVEADGYFYKGFTVRPEKNDK